MSKSVPGCAVRVPRAGQEKDKLENELGFVVINVLERVRPVGTEGRGRRMVRMTKFSMNVWIVEVVVVLVLLLLLLLLL